VLEYCAESELHPRSGSGMLKGRKILRSDLGKIRVSAASYRPYRAGVSSIFTWG